MSSDDLFSDDAAPLYTRPYQLPANIAFEILSYNNVEKRNSKEKTHKIVIKNDEFVNLMVYPGSRFPKMNDDTIPPFNERIKNGDTHYLVARRWTSIDRIRLDILTDAKRIEQKLPVFDCDVHVIKPVDAEGNLLSLSEEAKPAAKRFKSGP